MQRAMACAWLRIIRLRYIIVPTHYEGTISFLMILEHHFDTTARNSSGVKSSTMMTLQRSA